MRWNFVTRVAWKEIISTLRDRRTLISTIVLPLVMIPVFMIGLPIIIGKAFGGEAEKRQIVGVVGFARMPQALRTALEGDSTEGRGVQLRAIENAIEAVQAGNVEAAIEVPTNIPTQTGGPTVNIPVFVKTSSQRSQVVLTKLNSAIEAYGRTLIAARLRSVGLDEQTLRPVAPRTVSADTAAEQASGMFAFLIPLFIVQWILVGGQATAIDATAGEKERGTLEALLVTPISRLEVVLGKFLAVITFSVISTIFSMIGLAITGIIARSVLPSVFGNGDGAVFATIFGGSLSLDLGGFLLLLAVGLSIAMLISSVLLTVCIFARSFKEAQTYIAPIAIMLVIPSVLLQFADFLSRGTVFYAIPFVGSMITILDVVKGATNPGHAALAIVINLILTGVLLAFALSSFRRERVLFRN